MKRYISKKQVYYLSTLLVFSILFSNCGGDDPAPQVFDPPVISITTPDIPASGLEVELGQTVDIVLSVGAEAGLTSVTVNDQNVKTYGGTELSDVVTYQVAPDALGSLALEFKVTDSRDQTATVSATLMVVEPPVPPFVIADLAGSTTASITVDVENQGWDVRTVSTFNNSSDLSSSTATLEFVASQGHAMFAQNNPDASQSDKVLKMVGATSSGVDSWGGHYIFGMIGLGAMIPQSELEALPQISFNGSFDIDEDGTDDTSVAQITAGYTRVIQIDAYYDDTVNPNLSMNDIKQVTKIYGLDLSKGYQVDLILAKSNPHKEKTTGEIQGMYAAYSAWIAEPNQWVTLTFEVASEAQQQFLNDGAGINDETQRNPAAISEVDVVTIVPAYSHQIWGADAATTLDGDTNPIYFKNLRIVNVAE